jgi:PPOX class probable F420-dependent enzyme
MTALPVSTYVSLTTFRRNGAPVATPVWAAPDGETLAVWTRADSGKRGTRLGKRRTLCPRRGGERHELVRIRPT